MGFHTRKGCSILHTVLGAHYPTLTIRSPPPNYIGVELPYHKKVLLRGIYIGRPWGSWALGLEFWVWVLGPRFQGLGSFRCVLVRRFQGFRVFFGYAVLVWRLHVRVLLSILSRAVFACGLKPEDLTKPVWNPSYFYRPPHKTYIALLKSALL